IVNGLPGTVAARILPHNPVTGDGSGDEKVAICVGRKSGDKVVPRVGELKVVNGGPGTATVAALANQPMRGGRLIFASAGDRDTASHHIDIVMRVCPDASGHGLVAAGKSKPINRGPGRAAVRAAPDHPSIIDHGAHGFAGLDSVGGDRTDAGGKDSSRRMHEYR